MQEVKRLIKKRTEKVNKLNNNKYKELKCKEDQYQESESEYSIEESKKVPY